MIASIPAATLLGVEGFPVVVEAHVSYGMPGFALVGLPDTACREARDRVRSAFVSSQLPWPKTKITVNLAPSDLRKAGSVFDLAIAVAVLVAGGVIDAEAVDGYAFIGELGLDGSVRAVDGIVPLVASVAADHVVVAASCVEEATVVNTKRVRGISSLSDLVAALHAQGEWVDASRTTRVAMPELPDLADVRGQPLARWALEVAAAGGHNVLFVGPPGSGKTMLAKRLPGILPELDDDTSLMTTCIHSAAGLLSRTNPVVTVPPFRAPHHTSSRVSIAGGGTAAMRPGEISMAHGGVLFLDEMAEFPRSTLDTLRQPLEDGYINVSRAATTLTLPARFLLVGATNPCPCGEGLIPGRCRCGLPARERYMARISGPLLDRFDIRVQVMRPNPDQLFSQEPAEPSAAIRERVAKARERARQRGVSCNAQLSPKSLETWAKLDTRSTAVLTSRMNSNRLTARGLDRVRSIALTLADLDGVDVINQHHICSALELRPDLELNEEAA